MKTSVISENLYKLEWAAKKISSRDLMYVPRRLSYELRKKLVNIIFPILMRSEKFDFFSTPPMSDSEQLDYFRNRPAPKFHFNYQDIGKICSRIPIETKNRTIRAAEDVVNHRFVFKGVEYAAFDEIDWGFSPDGDYGWKWYLNRHFLFTTLGFAYWYTGDDRFARTFFDLSSSWIDTNLNSPVKLVTDHPFEVGARINAWLWGYFLFLHCKEWTPMAHHKYMRGLEILSEYLYGVIEYHNPGNHILLEAKALAMCAELFPEFKGSKRWARRAWRILAKELNNQICVDGVHAERSTMYHRIVAGELSELTLFCKRNNISEIEELGDLVKKMAEFESWIVSGNGSFPLFGDAYLSDPYIRFSAKCIFSCSNKPNNRESLYSYSEDQTYWILGTEPWGQDVIQPPEQGEDLAKSFRVGGYFVSRSGFTPTSSTLVWDCGPVGYKANPYHSHMDTLSFTLSVDGLPVLIDPGTEERDQNVRRYLRGTGAHNTVRVDGEDQSILAKWQEVWAQAEPRLLFWGAAQGCNVMIGSHNGYQRLPNPVEHIRTIISMRDKYWLIYDRIEGEGHHRAEQKFHIAPQVIVDVITPHERLLLNQQDVCLSVFPLNLAGSENTIAEQKTDVEKGIAELECGRPEEIKVINTTMSGPAPFSMATVFIPGQKQEISASVLPTKDHSLYTGIEVLHPHFVDNIYIQLAKTKTRQLIRGWNTDARILIERYERASGTNKVFIVDASILTRDETGTSCTNTPVPLEEIVRINTDVI